MKARIDYHPTTSDNAPFDWLKNEAYILYLAFPSRKSVSGIKPTNIFLIWAFVISTQSPTRLAASQNGEVSVVTLMLGCTLGLGVDLTLYKRFTFNVRRVMSRGSGC